MEGNMNPAIAAAISVLMEEGFKAQEELTADLNPLAEPLLARVAEIGEQDPWKGALACILSAAKFIEGAVIMAGREGEAAVNGCYEVGDMAANYAVARLAQDD